MSDDNTQINLLVLSAENDFQLKMVNTNLQDIATQLNQLNGNIRNSNLATNQYLNNTNKNLKELLTFLYNFTLNVSVSNADLKKLNKIIEDMRDNLNPLNINK